MKVTIRPLQEEDAEIAYQWRNDPEVFRYTGAKYDHTITYEDELNWIRKVINNTDQIRCAIVADNIYVGNIYLTDIDQYSAHYQIFIGNKSFWHKGVGTEASLLILQKAFAELNLEKVILRVKSDNKSAIRLYNNLGFQTIEAGNPWILMAITKETWQQKSAEGLNGMIPT